MYYIYTHLSLPTLHLVPDLCSFLLDYIVCSIAPFLAKAIKQVFCVSIYYNFECVIQYQLPPTNSVHPSKPIFKGSI